MLERRSPKRVCYVLFTADRGLCGGFNTNLIRKATEERKKKNSNVGMIFVGRKGFEHFKRFDLNGVHQWTDLFNNLEKKHADDISNYLIDLYKSKQYDSIRVIYSEFVSPVQQNVVVKTLLPFQGKRKAKGSKVRFKFEPSPAKILDTLVPKALNMQLWKILLESNTSELGARMSAMEAATENAEDMIKELTLYYNKTRQAAITKEISEIVGGAEALRG